MILVIGGAFQGKRAYAAQALSIPEEELIDGGSCDWEAIFRAAGIRDFQEYIRRSLLDKRDVGTLVEELVSRNPEVEVIANELGSGVVPVDAFDREYREVTGRICCALAKEAQEVHRVVCGIGTVIKHG